MGRRRGRIAAILIVAVTGMGFFAAAGWSPATSAARADTTLGNSPVGKVMVVTANMAEEVHGPLDTGPSNDNAESRDVENFSHRLHNVLVARKANGEPVYQPDLLLLQELNAETVLTAQSAISDALGQNYALAYTPAPGENAIVTERVGDTSARVVRDTTILYNTATMAMTSSHEYTFAYPFAQVWGACAPNSDPATCCGSDPQCCPPDDNSCSPDDWTSNQSRIVRFVSTRDGHPYAASSLHFATYTRMIPSILGRPDGFREGWWIGNLVAAMSGYYPNATQILGGDLNERLCVTAGHVEDGGCSGSPATDTPMYQYVKSNDLQTAFQAAGDHIFTSGQIASPVCYVDRPEPGATAHVCGKDDTYRLYGTTGAPASAYLNQNDYDHRFLSYDDFIHCDALYNAGLGTSAAAQAINGCGSRYYSDHSFGWALVQS